MDSHGWTAIEWETLRWAASSRNAAWWSVAATIFGSFATFLAIIAALAIPVWQRRLDRRDRLSSSAFAMYTKLNRIYSTILVIRNHLYKGMLVYAQDMRRPAWLHVQAINQLSGSIYFSSDGLWALARTGDSRLINEAGDLDQAFNNVLWAMDRYDRLREALSVELTPESINGEIATLAFTDERFLRYAPRFALMDSILKQVTPIADKLTWDAFSALDVLATNRRRPLGPKFEMHLSNPEGEPCTFAAPRPRRKWFGPNSPSSA